MPRFKVAHIKEQGVDLIIIPLKSKFGMLGNSEQAAETEVLQVRANSAGLAGTVVPVWNNGGNRMGFRAPQRWHPYFSGLSLSFVLQNLNREIFW
jgi:hypothetical protein